MIELNCTYEESKKIFELGYDFTEICTEWQDRELSTPCITDKYKLPETACPIIPKAALEACLPDLSYSTYVRGWLGHTLCDLDHREYSPNLITLAKRFNSVYEAFMWCHENYPEELRKKFEEVMR